MRRVLRRLLAVFLLLVAMLAVVGLRAPYGRLRSDLHQEDAGAAPRATAGLRGWRW